jgi:NhaP-type Na+/H+ or K+/H+ antiporter
MSYVPYETVQEALRETIQVVSTLVVVFIIITIFIGAIAVFFAYKYEQAKKELDMYQLTEKLRKELKEEKT